MRYRIEYELSWRHYVEIECDSHDEAEEEAEDHKGDICYDFVTQVDPDVGILSVERVRFEEEA